MNKGNPLVVCYNHVPMYFHLNRGSVLNQLFQTYLPGSLPMFSHQKTRKDAQKRHGDTSVPANISDTAPGICCFSCQEGARQEGKAERAAFPVGASRGQSRRPLGSGAVKVAVAPDPVIPRLGT